MVSVCQVVNKELVEAVWELEIVQSERKKKICSSQPTVKAILEDCDIPGEVDLLHLIASEYFRSGLSGSSVYTSKGLKNAWPAHKAEAELLDVIEHLPVRISPGASAKVS